MKTKKIIAVVLLICLAFTGAISVGQVRAKKAAGTSEGSEEYYEALQELLESVPQVDCDALYALHPAEEVVAHVGGRDVTWGEYFQHFCTYISNIEEYMMQSVLYYGTSIAWNDTYDEASGLRWKDLPGIYAGEQLRQYAAIANFAEENGIALSAENAALADSVIEQAKLSACGGDASDEEFNEYLRESYLTEPLYRKLVEASLLYQQMFTDLYGENGSGVSDEDAVGYMEENGYIHADCILFATRDSTTGESFGEEETKAIKDRAALAASELREETDAEKRFTLFEEYKKEYDGDSARSYFPNGYTYTAGSLGIPGFEEAAVGLEEYGTADVLESSYGYYVIMRLPLDPDAEIEYSDSGTALTGRSKFANEDYSLRLQEKMNAEEVVFADGFTVPEISA